MGKTKADDWRQCGARRRTVRMMIEVELLHQTRKMGWEMMTTWAYGVVLLAVSSWLLTVVW
jgi:hypothetical protein